MHYVDIFRLDTSKVLLSAFFRVSILRYAALIEMEIENEQTN